MSRRPIKLQAIKLSSSPLGLLRTYAKYLLLIELALAAVLVVGLLVPLPGRVEFKIVQSGSMEPVVPVGALVAIVPRAEYTVGDIITFGDDTRTRIPTTHRIVGVERVAGATHYRTKGDANEEADNTPVPHSAVVGGVALTVPRLGFVLDFARTQDGYLAMVVVPASLIILDELITIVVALRRRRTGAEYAYADDLANANHPSSVLPLVRGGGRPPRPAGEGWGEGLRSSLPPTTYHLQPRARLQATKLSSYQAVQPLQPIKLPSYKLQASMDGIRLVPRLA